MYNEWHNLQGGARSRVSKPSSLYVYPEVVILMYQSRICFIYLQDATTYRANPWSCSVHKTSVPRECKDSYRDSYRSPYTLTYNFILLSCDVAALSINPVVSHTCRTLQLQRLAVRVLILSRCREILVMAVKIDQPQDLCP